MAKSTKNASRKADSGNAVDKKKAATEQMPEPNKSFARDIFEVLLFGLSILLFFKTFVWQNFQIPTSSMENSLLIGDHITANTFMFKAKTSLDRVLFPTRDVKRGDVVVFKFPENPKEDYIKRCVGVPGNRIQMINDRMYLDGEFVNEQHTYYRPLFRGQSMDRDPERGYYPVDYFDLKPGIDNAADNRSYTSFDVEKLLNLTESTLRNHYRRKAPEAYERILKRLRSGEKGVIPDGFYLMLGDNRNNSRDSRYWGLVPEELIHGRAYFVWWSYGEDINSHKAKGWDLIMSYARVPFTFWTRTHWRESFSRIR